MTPRIIQGAPTVRRRLRLDAPRRETARSATSHSAVDLMAPPRVSPVREYLHGVTSAERERRANHLAALREKRDDCRRRRDARLARFGRAPRLTSELTFRDEWYAVAEREYHTWCTRAAFAEEPHAPGVSAAPLQACADGVQLFGVDAAGRYVLSVQVAGDSETQELAAELAREFLARLNDRQQDGESARYLAVMR